MSSIFSRIIAREIPAHIVDENQWAIAFMDIRPLQIGHVLVVPKYEVDKLFELPEEPYTQLWQFARHIASALEKTVPCNRIGVTVYGLEVPHAHIHLIPIQREGDMDFSQPLQGISQDQLAQLAKDIKANL
ncbi:MAG: HIT family protein [Flavobacteriales bacterium]|nr:MAG: HIT family protein [Flavobacteriales bacterium]